MKIVYVITRCDDLGGAQIHVRDLATHMRSLGHESYVLGGSPGVLSQALEAANVPFVEVVSLQRSILPWNDVRCFFELRRILRRLKPDLVSAHSSKAGVLARAAAWSLNIPVLFTAHGWACSDGVPTTKRLLYTWIERAVAPLANKILTVSEYDRSIALQKKIAPSAKVVTVHNGMPPIQPELFAKPENEPPRFVTIARHDNQKDYETLLRAFALVAKRHPDWRLQCIGGGRLLDETQKWIESLGLGGSVELLGLRSDVAQLLANAQVYLLVSHYEGLPRSILEAMRAGLPVIASNVGGVAELVQDQVTGFLVPRLGISELAQAIERLGVDHQARARMGAEGRRSFESRFQFNHMLQKTLSAYKSVLVETVSGVALGVREEVHQ